MKKFTTAIAAALLAFSFSAQAAELTGNVGAQSKYVWRGVQQSGEQASLNATVRASIGGLFGQVETNTLSNRSDLFTTATAGYNTSIAGVDLTAGYNQHLLTGQGKASHDQNFNEVFVAAAVKGLDAFVAQTIDAPVGGGRDTYARVGFTTPSILGFTGNVGTAYTHYRNEGVTRHTNYDATLSYKLKSNVDVYVGYNEGGRDVRNAKLPNATTFGAKIGF
jgi:hypothetical protein